MGATENSLSLNPQSIDWGSSENHILLNPRWSSQEIQLLQQVAQSISLKRNLQGHLWLATSGSTAESVGHIKLVALAKNAFLASAKAVNAHLQISNSDIWLQVLPRFHVGGLGVEVRGLLSKSEVVCDFSKWNPERAHKTMEASKITIASLVPTQVFDLVQAKLPSPKNLRAVIVGGGPLNEALYKEARKWGWPLLPSYGMTETCSQIATASLESFQSSDMPRPKKLSHVEWRLTPTGILQVRGPSLLTCYGQRQKEGTFHDWDPKEEGWFTTEDFVNLQDSSIHFIGRKNDFIKIGGEGSSMARLMEIFERLLNSLAPSVAQQVLLIDAPSERLGVEIHLITTLNPQLPAAQELLSQLKEKFDREVLPFERIREIKYTPVIPRSELGKVMWMQLKRDLYGC
ncbi:MAG: AMP-binding protein [Pseudobdellovibrionaceae bacterium]